ncbi:MAG: Ig-like domain-containing protein [Bacteroidetes bacterium]|nr:Ig-like domain-containing protein [Bacteroidota bacterium]
MSLFRTSRTVVAGPWLAIPYLTYFCAFMKGSFSGILLGLSLLIVGGCANIVPPSGGPKDETAPKLISISPADSQLNSRVTELVLRFDEYITLNDPTAQIQIAPLLPQALEVTAQLRSIKIKIPDSLLEPNTTYRLSFGTAIRDLHEGNIYQSNGYVFSTGNYFDSLSLQGSVLNAATGLPDSAATLLLYSANVSDSAITRQKPRYTTHVGALGNFQLSGLPAGQFKLFALRDENHNLLFDGSNEWVGFSDTVITLGSGAAHAIKLYTFPQALQAADSNSSVASESKTRFGSLASRKERTTKLSPGHYEVLVDTTQQEKRTQDLNSTIEIHLGRKLQAGLKSQHIFLSADSAGMTVEMPFQIEKDTTGLLYRLKVDWLENTRYTLRLQKGFAQDSNGNDLMPGRFSFRTKRDDDYGKLQIHLPTSYYREGYILQVSNNVDTVYQAPISDTMVQLNRLPPGNYTLRVIGDKNKNGRWDAGNLFLKIQPELVIPYDQNINLKAGWEQQIDFIPTRRKPKMEDRFR